MDVKVSSEVKKRILNCIIYLLVLVSDEDAMVLRLRLTHKNYTHPLWMIANPMPEIYS